MFYIFFSVKLPSQIPMPKPTDMDVLDNDTEDSQVHPNTSGGEESPQTWNPCKTNDYLHFFVTSSEFNSISNRSYFFQTLDCTNIVGSRTRIKFQWE